MSNICVVVVGWQDKDDDVLKRDFSAPTLEDHFNKTVLPKVMQVLLTVHISLLYGSVALINVFTVHNVLVFKLFRE